MEQDLDSREFPNPTDAAEKIYSHPYMSGLVNYNCIKNKNDGLPDMIANGFKQAKLHIGDIILITSLPIEVVLGHVCEALWALPACRPDRAGHI